MRSERFVGRHDQLVLLDAATRQAATGQPQVVVFGGAGIGKTRLMTHFADRIAETGARVLRTGCVELGTAGLPLVPLNTALRQLVGQIGVETLRQAQPGIDALLGLLPEFDAPAPGDEDRTRCFDLFGALLARLGSEHPLLWIIDDLHWADRSTRELLGFLARTLYACRVLVVAAYRDDDLHRGHPLRAFLAELRRLAGVTLIELAGFSRAETAELLGDVPAETLERVYRRSGGNPFYAVELAQVPGADGLPDNLRDLLLRQVGDLPADARLTVARAAVCGPVVSHGLLAAISGLAEPDLLEALRAAVRMRILVPEETGYAFRHSLLRDAARDELLPAERVRLHRRSAEALEADPGLVPPGLLPAAVAFHWHQAGEDAKALPALLQAAKEAQRLSAFAEQAQLLAQALSVWPRVPDAQRVAGGDRLVVFESAIAAATWAGDDLLALHLTDQALEIADPAAEPARVAMLLAHRGMALHQLGRDGALIAVEESLGLLPPDVTVPRARVLDFLASILALRGRPQRARTAAEEAMQIAVELGASEVEISARTTLGWALNLAGAYPEALEVLRASRKLAEDSADEWQLARVHLNLAGTHQALGQYAEAINTAHRGLEVARQAGVERSLGPLLYRNLAFSLAAAGRWDEADTMAMNGTRLDAPATCAADLHAIRAEIALARGDLARTGEELSRGLDTASVVHQQAELALHENRVEDARHHVVESLAATRDAGEPAQIWPILTTGARVENHARLRRNRPEDRGGLLDELRAAAEQLPADTPVLSAYAAEFAAELGEGDWPAAIAAWEGIGQLYRSAYARLRAAQAALASGDRDTARDQLRTAADQAGELGARPLLDEIQVLARSAHLAVDGAKTTERADTLGLTDRETEVLRLVAAGRSNKQIAEALFVSAKTVSVHVSNILAKFGASSRGEAAATAHRLRLFDSDATG